MKESLTEEEISSIIKGLVKTAHIVDDLKDDLFQELYVYYLQLIEKYRPDMNVPFKAYVIKFLKWKRGNIVKDSKNNTAYIDLNTIQAEEEEEEVMFHHIIPSNPGNLGISSDNLIEEELELLYLRHISGKSYQQLSEITKLSIEGIRKKLKRIEGKIRWETRQKEIKKNEK